MELIRRLIAHASDDLVEEIYRRILTDKQIEVNQRPLEIPMAKSGEQIMGQAVKEGVFTEEETVLLLDDPVFEEKPSRRKKKVA